MLDGLDLGRAQPRLCQRGGLPDAGFGSRVGLGQFVIQPLSKRLRPMKGKDIATCCVRLQQIRETSLDPGALVAEWERTLRSNDPVVLTEGKGTPEMQGKAGQIN